MPVARFAVALSLAAAAGLVATAGAATTSAAAGTTPAAPPAYRAGDYADGLAMSILAPGENGLVNATDLAKFELTQARPPAATTS